MSRQRSSARLRERRPELPQEVVTEALGEPASRHPLPSKPDAQRVPSAPSTRHAEIPAGRQASKRHPTNGKLETHENEGNDQQQLPQGNTEKRPRRAKWDPFARYLSNDASSFPSYEAPSVTMGPADRIKRINAATGPKNTFLGRGPGPLPVEPPGKRRKKDNRPQIEGTSSHFVKPKPRPVEEVQDLTEEDPLDIQDVYDIQSVSSAGKPTSASTVQEYRNAQVKRIGGSRKRRSRPASGSQGLPENLSPNQRASPLKNHAQEPLSDSNSADDLAKDPPPANVMSDIVRERPKRLLPSPFQSSKPLALKRTIGAQARDSAADEADELNDEPITEDQARTKRAKLSRHPLEIPHRSSQTRRGDIKTTTFTNMQKVNGVGSAVRPLLLRKAVSGPHTYEQGDGPHSRIYLHVENGNEVRPRDELGDPVLFAWLQCDLSKALDIRHAVTRSPYVLVFRSMTNQCPGQLFLEFDNPAEAVSIIKGVPESVSTKEEDETKLEKTFQLNFQRAKEHSKSSVGNMGSSHTTYDHQSPPANASSSLETKGRQPKKEKLTEIMRRSAHGPKLLQLDLTREPESLPGRTLGLGTRSTRRSSPIPQPREPSPDRWTCQNPDWGTCWQRSLVFPPTGKNRATVDKDDIPRLDEGEFLNDNLISFYLRYLQVRLEEQRPDLLNKVYFFSSFFFEKLRSTKPRLNYEGVKAWTAKVDLLSYDYIVVPVNENAHWYLAIICNAPNALNGIPEDDDVEEVEVVDIEAASFSPKVAAVERHMSSVSLGDPDVVPPLPTESVDGIGKSSPTNVSRGKTLAASRTTGQQRFGAVSKNDARHPRIMTLDSLGNAHSATSKCLKEYLLAEALDKKKVELKVTPAGLSAKGIPQQNNYCDCGVFVLGYIEEFLKNPDEAARKLLQRENTEWDIKPSELRAKIRDLVFKLEKEQRQADADKKASIRNKKKSTPAGADRMQSSPPVRTPLGQSEGRGGTPGSKNELQSSATFTEGRQSACKPGIRSSAPPAVDSTPVKSRQLPITQDEHEQKLVSGLEDDSSPSSEQYYSAASNPDLKQKGSVSRVARAGDGLAQVEANLMSRASQPGFVQPLLSSSSDNDGGGPTDATTPVSVEVTGVSRRHLRPKTRRPKALETESRFFAPIPSVEKDETEQPRRGPQYDGVDPMADRTVDLTN